VNTVQTIITCGKKDERCTRSPSLTLEGVAMGRPTEPHTGSNRRGDPNGICHAEICRQRCFEDRLRFPVGTSSVLLTCCRHAHDCLTCTCICSCDTCTCTDWMPSSSTASNRQSFYSNASRRLELLRHLAHPFEAILYALRGRVHAWAIAHIPAHSSRSDIFAHQVARARFVDLLGT